MTTDELKGFGLTDEQCKQVENLHSVEILALQGQIGEKDTMISGLNGQLSEANKKLEGYDPEWKGLDNKKLFTLKEESGIIISDKYMQR